MVILILKVTISLQDKVQYEMRLLQGLFPPTTISGIAICLLSDASPPQLDPDVMCHASASVRQGSV